MKKEIIAQQEKDIKKLKEKYESYITENADIEKTCH